MDASLTDIVLAVAEVRPDERVLKVDHWLTGFETWNKVAEVRPDERVLKVFPAISRRTGSFVAEVRPDERVLKVVIFLTQAQHCVVLQRFDPMRGY